MSCPPTTKSPQSASSKPANREVVVITSWGRAILLQLAHPAIAAGVDGHSGFRGSLLNGLRRGRSTVRAMLAFTFGDRDQMVATAAGINSIHDRVRGRGDEGTGAYSAHDPDLQRWVSWCNNRRFAGLSDDPDPIAGDNGLPNWPSYMTLPRPEGAVRTSALPRFVTVGGGAYLFVPGLAALGFLASMP